ncbi:Putative DNA-binding protein [Streptomyces venezuelae]|uniref:helix-turn-helix domain-containing protein n=1 Tax=Streptomyces gardneri TaxID=66892 RepID=UPI0006BCFF2F|nr:helix-turn-helix transcriptional regulator [Streptomyces gardneri]ALO09999.1 Putative DNA-binding protein [Streptomyces venezuelae]QPK47039.1 helix-turn-helix domain-containing protein [Streptomyces gardneri]WRK38456.1 helix-turn-helix transcriptional regulator [Streptomyces venezuelae]CUM39555.1 putative DNA-binding protein [Streptomyces venezuelae]
MSTDFQAGREALGARLRELRAETGLNGKVFAALLSWPASKVSRLQNGKQTPSIADLEAWATAAGKPEALSELKGRLAGLETTYRSWRRQLAAGHRPRQEQGIAETAATSRIRGVEVVRIPGLFQTPEYARYVFEQNAEFRETPRDVDAAVRARIRRQEALYDPDKRFEFLIYEPALHARTSPVPVHAAQLDRLMGVIGLDTVKLGIIPLGARLRRAPSHGFWIYDRRLVIVETINTEMWLEDESAVELYERSWEWLTESAVYGEQAQRLIGRVRAALTNS